MRSTRRTHTVPQVRHFTRPVCGAVNPATNCKGRTPRGHIKTMYCYRCRKNQNQEQTD